MSPGDLHKYILEHASYDLPTSSIYRMIRQNRIKGERVAIPRSTRTAWTVSQEEADALVEDYKGYPIHLSPLRAIGQRSKAIRKERENA